MEVRYPVATMVARSGHALPGTGPYACEAKFDGWRMVAFHARRPQLQSRQQRSLTRMFPEIAEAVADQLPPGTVVDGELVAMRDGRVDFTAITAGDAARRLVVFDVLAVAGRDVRPESYRDRRARLAELLEQAAPPLALTPVTDDLQAAHAWMAETARGVEGVVVKHLDHAYLPGRRWWTKVRALDTSEAVVGGVIGPVDRPHALILGRYDRRGRLCVVGRTHPLPRAAAEEVGRCLRRPVGVHPWPIVIPGGRLGLAGKHDPVEHTPVAPTVVVELDVDGAIEYGRWRHGARYRRVRTELCVRDLAPQ